MPNLTIFNQNQLVPRGQVLTVSGRASDKGFPEPNPIQSVTVRLDSGPVIQATLKKLKSDPKQPLTVSFVSTVQMPSVDGSHTITVTAINDIGRSATKTFFVEVVQRLAAKQPQSILEIVFGNPDQPKDVDALYAQAVALGK